MAWGSQKPTKEQTLEQLAEAGLDVEGVNNLSTKLKDFDPSKVASVEAIDQLKNTFETSLRELASKIPQQQQQQQQQTQTNNDQDEEFDVLDPAGWLNRQMEKKLSPIATLSTYTLNEQVYNNFKQTTPDFKLFEKEVKKRWDETPLHQRGNPQEFLNNIYLIEKGKNFERVKANPSEFEVEAPTSFSGRRTPDHNDDKPDYEKLLTPAQRKEATRTGLGFQKYYEAVSGVTHG